MLGTIVICMEQLVRDEYGNELWENILEKSGLSKDHNFYSHKEVDDDVFKQLFDNGCEILSLTKEQLSDAFGEAWMIYAKKTYFAFFMMKKNAKDFLLDMDRTHTKITDRIENAAPPKFTYKEIDESNLMMSYSSKRDLPHLWIGLVKAVGKYYNETVSVENIDEYNIKITFHGKNE